MPIFLLRIPNQQAFSFRRFPSPASIPPPTSTSPPLLPPLHRTPAPCPDLQPPCAPCCRHPAPNTALDIVSARRRRHCVAPATHGRARRPPDPEVGGAGTRPALPPHLLPPAVEQQVCRRLYLLRWRRRSSKCVGGVKTGSGSGEKRRPKEEDEEFFLKRGDPLIYGSTSQCK